MPTRPAAKPTSAAPNGAVVGGREEGGGMPKVFAAGTRLGRYELISRISSGGMGHVWKAEQTGDLGFRKVVALKMIHPDFANDSHFRSMFLEEARLASRLQHPNIVEVLDLGVEGPVVFLAMPFIDGASLSGWTQRASADVRLGLGVTLRIVIDMLHGLHAAHELKDSDGTSLGLIHRDVSPQNVLVGLDGITKLADFGIAKAFGRLADETCIGDVKGKLGYLAPEVLDGAPATRESDLFSAGVVLWELLTGKRLFSMKNGGGGGPEIDAKAARKLMTPHDPQCEAAEIPRALAAIVMRALERNPAARFRTSLEMALALEGVIRDLGIPNASQLDVSRALLAIQSKKKCSKTAFAETARAIEAVVVATMALPISFSVPTPMPVAPMPVARKPMPRRPRSLRWPYVTMAIAACVTFVSATLLHELDSSARSNISVPHPSPTTTTVPLASSSPSISSTTPVLAVVESTTAPPVSVSTQPAPAPRPIARVVVVPSTRPRSAPAPAPAPAPTPTQTPAPAQTTESNEPKPRFGSPY